VGHPVRGGPGARARRSRDFPAFERTLAAYRRRLDQAVEEREERERQAERERRRAAEDEAYRRKSRRAERMRLVYQAKVRGSAKYDKLLADAKRVRDAARLRLRRRGERATDEDREAVRAAGEAVAREVEESGRRRAQARVDMAVQRSTFPRLTKRFAEARPEAAARIRELSRLHALARRGARYRRIDFEHQRQLMERRESLLREAWAVATA
jgi:hypothetical protein